MWFGPCGVLPIASLQTRPARRKRDGLHVAGHAHEIHRLWRAGARDRQEERRIELPPSHGDARSPKASQYK
eukprot:8810586-Lingulodinium_polyedra.AAC.1